MSDFFSSGWSIYIAVATIVGLVACLALLIIAARRRVMAGDNTTGHVWDEDLRELNNPLPRWWMWLFVLTVLFAGGYLAAYPGLGSMAGSLKWTSIGRTRTSKPRHEPSRRRCSRASPRPRYRRSHATRRQWRWANASSRTTAPCAMAPTRAAARASRT